jgi:hypothetical protein
MEALDRHTTAAHPMANRGQLRRNDARTTPSYPDDQSSTSAAIMVVPRRRSDRSADLSTEALAEVDAFARRSRRFRRLAKTYVGW